MVGEWFILHKYKNVSKTANGLDGVFQSLRVAWIGRDDKPAMVAAVWPLLWAKNLNGNSAAFFERTCPHERGIAAGEGHRDAICSLASGLEKGK